VEVDAAEAAEALIAPSDEALAFPQTYGRTRVRVLMQSPGRLYVHWDLSPAVAEDLRRQLGQRAAVLARLALRITTPSADRPLMVLLPRNARSWYVDVPGQRFEYRAELGVMLPSGEFRAVAQSNLVRLARTKPSPVAAQRRVEVERERPPAAEAVGELPADEPTEEERREADLAAASEFPGGVIDAEERVRSGGSSELTAARGARRAPAGGKPAEGAAPLGGSSDLVPPGSSSDLRPRR
jgi:hypothetical protein